MSSVGSRFQTTRNLTEQTFNWGTSCLRTDKTCMTNENTVTFTVHMSKL